MFRRIVPALLLLCMGIFASQLLAQTTTTGVLAGIVTDPTGALVPDANITLQDVARGATQNTTANKQGEYRFDLLLPGTYSITAKAKGFQTIVERVEVTVGSITKGDLKLSLGTETTTVEVSGEAPLMQTESGNVNATVLETQAANIPNPGNDLTYMAQIAPGSVANTAGGGLGNFSSYGISAVANLFTVNGMDDNDPFLNVNNSGATNLTLGQNEIEEVAVVTNGYSGQYGGLAGANVNYITRSGTNRFHGRASWFWNGDALNANNWFNNARTPKTPRSFVNANQYGADIGGPIVKDKLFFYANFEGLYLVVPTSAQTFIPDSAFATAVQNNINTTFGAGSTISKFYQNIFNLYAGAPGASRAQPVAGGGCDGSVAISQCADSFVSNVNNKTHENLQSYRIDWNVSSRDRLFGRIQRDHGLQATITDPINALFNVQSDQPEWQGQASETHTFSNGAVNSFLASGQWYSSTFSNAKPAATLAAFPTTLSFAGGNFSNLGGIDFDFPQGRRVTQFQVSDDYSKIFGAHTLKIGAKYRRNWVTNTDYSILSTGLIVSSTLASFFNGGGDGNTNLQQAFPTALEQPFAVYNVGGYVEDDWKAKPNLTLTFSLRLDHQSIPVCFSNCFARPSTQFPQLSTDPTTPYNQLLLVNQKQMLPDLTSIEPQPRFGFAWTPGLLHNTVVRGGIGIFYDAFPGALLDGFSENPPLDPTFTVVKGNISSPSDPNSLFASAAGSNAAFQNGFKSGASFNSLTAALPGVFSAPNLAASVNHPKVPQYQKWNLGIEHQFGQNTSVAVQYVGNHGIHIYTQNSGINGCNNSPGGNQFTSLPACNVTSGAGINPSFLLVNYAESLGVSNYNGMTASFTHRYRSGLVQLNYSYSHALDTVSNSGVPADAFGNVNFFATNNSMVFPENPANPRQFNYSNADYDSRHILNANYVWELPIKRFITRGHGSDRLLKGWDVNGAVFLRTGFPYTVVNNALSSQLQSGGYGSSNFLVDVFGIQTAPGGTGVNCATLFPKVVQPGKNFCQNPANFNVANASAQSTFGNLSRNTIRGPNYRDFDFSIMKHTKVTESSEFVFGAQFFNLFNHPNFDAPVMDVSNSKFGQIIRTVSPPTTLFGSVLGADASPRLIQAKLQFIF